MPNPNPLSRSRPKWVHWLLDARSITWKYPLREILQTARSTRVVGVKSAG